MSTMHMIDGRDSNLCGGRGDHATSDKTRVTCRRCQHKIAKAATPEVVRPAVALIVGVDADFGGWGVEVVCSDAAIVKRAYAALTAFSGADDDDLTRAQAIERANKVAALLRPKGHEVSMRVVKAEAV